MNERMDGLWVNGWMDVRWKGGLRVGGWIDAGWMDGWMGAWMDGCMDGWMDECICRPEAKIKSKYVFNN